MVDFSWRNSVGVIWDVVGVLLMGVCFGFCMRVCKNLFVIIDF